MSTDASQPSPAPGGCRPLARRRSLLVAALAAILVAATAVQGLALPSGSADLGRLQSDLSRLAKLTNRGARPPAQRLAQQLPAEAGELGELREPAATARDQAGIALDELREMSAPATLNPHYLPALVAAGRAFVAAGGQDPLTRTPINPEYLGLEAELAASETRLRQAGEDAAKLLARVKRLGRALVRAKRRAGRLQRRLQRAAPRPATGRR